jgi:hypothetical protein
VTTIKKKEPMKYEAWVLQKLDRMKFANRVTKTADLLRPTKEMGEALTEATMSHRLATMVQKGTIACTNGQWWKR